MELSNVKERILPIQESAIKGFERETKITDFEILRQYLSNSVKNVYLVRHKETKSEFIIYAIDKINGEINNESIGCFRREVENMYKYHHNNLVKLYSHFEDNHYCYLVMENNFKGDLKSLIPNDKKKCLNLKLCSFLIRDIISAVYYLHHMKPPIIHCHIKPENILLGKGLEAHLTNFDLDNLFVNYMRKSLHPLSVYETSLLMENEPYGTTVDLWNIGILLFEMITSDKPFLVKDADIFKANISTLRINCSKVKDEDAKDLIAKILKIDPKERLTLEEMMKHPFITKYTPDASKLLIKPVEDVKYEPFIISKDDPKIWVPKEIK